MVDVRENWRVALLVVFILIAGFALLSPTLAADDGTAGSDVAATSSVTNLQYGLELSGGTRVRAPLVGVTAEDVSFGADSTRAVEQAVADELENAGPADVIARTGVPAGQQSSAQAQSETTTTVEVTAENVTTDELTAALDATGYATEEMEVRGGVTDATRQEVVRILQNKINEAGLSGGTVQQVTTAQGENYVLVEVPNQDASSVRELVSERGTVVIEAYYPTGNGSYARDVVLQQEDFQSIGTAQEGRTGGAYVPVTVSESVAPEFQQSMVDTGLAQQGGTRCVYQQDRNNTEPCLLLVVNGEVTNAFGMSPGLADSLRSGAWEQDPVFQLQTTNVSEAQDVAINLRAGALPAQLDFSQDSGGTVSYISPSQGADFRINSLITGIIAVLAVSGVVFVRYSDVRVAAPMVVTALSEVVILLGFAAGIGYPLDLSVIAGFIAVIGTGVDDLIIIADEVMAEGEINSRRVFQSRFRKAFWVIGAAAATTIIAMSPLAILSLGDLQGFAIFTILGVLVGVLITRPAYGDILRSLTTIDR
ncbi:preprotein translocase subunit SecD [Halobellus inordinatus]|uniref:preprotein translocase subunit SecD n=1 Tax=Halobellus inordinatus TaxID=1126236 RepID=UPI0021152C53|nr:preprotein translocase subunit SecD [Halobellus ramosii]